MAASSSPGARRGRRRRASAGAARPRPAGAHDDQPDPASAVIPASRSTRFSGPGGRRTPRSAHRPAPAWPGFPGCAWPGRSAACPRRGPTARRSRCGGRAGRSRCPWTGPACARRRCGCRAATARRTPGRPAEPVRPGVGRQVGLVHRHRGQAEPPGHGGPVRPQDHGAGQVHQLGPVPDDRGPDLPAGQPEPEARVAGQRDRGHAHDGVRVRGPSSPGLWRLGGDDQGVMAVAGEVVRRRAGRNARRR